MRPVDKEKFACSFKLHRWSGAMKIAAVQQTSRIPTDMVALCSSNPSPDTSVPLTTAGAPTYSSPVCFLSCVDCFRALSLFGKMPLLRICIPWIQPLFTVSSDVGFSLEPLSLMTDNHMEWSVPQPLLFHWISSPLNEASWFSAVSKKIPACW